MRKDLVNKMNFLPLPVLMIGTYDKEGKANVMNAAWGGIYDYGKIYIALSKHKTTENLELKKAFTVSFATKKTEEISDYFGVVSGNDKNLNLLYKYASKFRIENKLKQYMEVLD